MGLDMYLARKLYIGRHSDDVKEEEKEEIELKDWADRPFTTKKEDIKELVFDAGYWKKANQIHKWFVDNVQDGNDDCGEYPVSRSDLKNLLDTVNEVLEASELVDGKVANGSILNETGWEPNWEDGKTIKDPTLAKELLPMSEGFFFGSTNYDQYYIEDLELTKNILEKALNEPEGDYYYSSSW